MLATATTTILPFFQAALALSFLITIIIVARLYRGIRILNARIDILSNLLKNLRKEIELTSGIDEVVFDEFDAFDAELQTQLKDFTPSRGSSMELFAARANRPLIKSTRPGDKKSSPEQELVTYEAKESGLNVEVKSDMSYIATHKSGQSERISLPDLPDQPEEEAQT